MLLASYIFEACQLELADPEYVRWTVPELAVYLTEAVSQVAALKPTLFTEMVSVGLGPGSTQTVPDGYSELVDVLFNLNTDGTEGERITAAAFAVARAFGRPSCAAPYGYAVRSYTLHPDSDKYFYVDPPVPAGERPVVRALVQRAPNRITQGSDAVLMANTQPEVYLAALKDYVLYRAFAKDMESSDSFERSQAHYKAFMQFLGVPPRDKNAVPVANSKRETVNNGAASA